MRWHNHMLIAAAPAALVSPRLIPVAILGSTAPDWLEWLAKLARNPVQHRGPTHWLAAWLLVFAIALTLPAPVGTLVAAFAWGG